MSGGGEVPQWGADVVAKLSPEEITEALRKGHLAAYLGGEAVEPSQGPVRPVQATADEVAAMSVQERAQALQEGRLADYMSTPTVHPAGGAEL
ncbi:hypothetical protein [Streptomyces sp. NPDC049744]|uniref:hypothetical protein n=1 Tax=Streptomyces sp. NPDC049744 TaxID=3154359 RepID=UPI003414C6CA